jgi:hypothetical protein
MVVVAGIFCEVVVCTITIILYSIWAVVICSDVWGWLIMSC